MGGAPNSSAALYVDTTEVEPTSANRIAHSRGWKSLLVVAGVRVTASVLRTRPQGGQQVGDLVVTVVILGLLALGDRERLSPGRLGLDELLELILVVVLTLLGSKSTAIVSISDAAILTSCGRTFASLSSPSRIAGRISSGHSNVCSISTSLYTRSAHRRVRLRSVNVQIASRSVDSSASRISTYARVERDAGSRK